MISEERIKKFWEWCGWQYEEPKCDCPGCAKSCWVPPDKPTAFDGRYLTCGLPDLDLNNLFKWAVPKLSGWLVFTVVGAYGTGEVKYRSFMHAKKGEDMTEYAGVSDDFDPATALFLAIEKLMEVQ